MEGIRFVWRTSLHLRSCFSSGCPLAVLFLARNPRPFFRRFLQACVLVAWTVPVRCAEWMISVRFLNIRWIAAAWPARQIDGSFGCPFLVREVRPCRDSDKMADAGVQTPASAYLFIRSCYLIPCASFRISPNSLSDSAVICGWGSAAAATSSVVSPDRTKTPIAPALCAIATSV